MKKLEYKNFEIKSLSHDESTNELIVDGYAAIFNKEDSLSLSWHPEMKKFVLAKDIIHNGSFEKTLSERKSRIKFCRNHNTENPVGKPLEIKEDETGLFTSTRISDAEDDLKIKIREGIFNEMSIGYSVVKCTFTLLDDGTYVRDIYELQLYEYSIVTLGRHEDAKLTELKNLSGASEIIKSMLLNEKNEEKKFQLLQLQSLIDGEPDTPLIQQEPNEGKVLNFSKYKFIK
jgi:HK97 family phage prohead protease